MNRSSQRISRIIVVFVLLVLGTSAARAAEDLWYRMTISGAPSGWTHVTEGTGADGQRLFTSESTFQLRRGEAEISISAQTEWIDTVEGRPISMTMRQDMGQQRVTTIWTFKGDEIEIVTEQGGRRTTSTAAAPGEPWLTPAAGADEFKRRANAGETTIKLTLLTPDFGLTPVKSTFTRTGEETMQVLGKETAVTTWSMVMDKLPFPGVMKYDKDWTLVFSELEAPFGKVIGTLSTSTEALAAASGKGAELLESLLVKADRKIPDWLHARKGTFRLFTKEGDMPELPSSGYQHVGTREGDSLELVINLDDPTEASKEDLANEEFMSTSAMIDTNDEQIRTLVEKALEDAGPSKAERAEALREYVHQWISRKNYSTAFASASEVARNRTGDCSEHGVLLAAMLRIDGIPSRTASGLVYVPSIGQEHDVYGWHMWTQAIIDGKWIDLDATLPVPFTVGHVLADTSSLANETGMGDQMNLLTLMGNLRINVVEVETK